MPNSADWLCALRDLSLAVCLGCCLYNQMVLSRRISNLWDALRLIRRLSDVAGSKKENTDG